MNKQVPLIKRLGKFKEWRWSTLVLLMAFFLPQGLNAQYCSFNAPINGYCCGGASAMGVNNFTMGTINNTSMYGQRTSGTYSPLPLEDYTSQVLNVTPGQTLGFTVTTNNSYNQTIVIWVDWDNDLTFNNTAGNPEIAYYIASSNIGSQSGTITIPCATPGNKRMRVFSDYAPSWGSTMPSPCATIYYGTVHDYTLNVAALSGLDVELAAKNSPATFGIGNNNLNVKVRNSGSTPITSCVIGYQLGNNTKVTQNVNFGSPLTTCTSMDLSFSTPVSIPAAGFYTLKIWANLPNGVSPDNKPLNDSLILNICTGLSGTYTINPTGTGTSNFTSFSSAVAALVNCGVAGPVVFNVAAGTYNEAISIPPIIGSSTTNTITFTGGAGGTNTRILQYNGTVFGAHQTVVFAGSKNIRFDNMTIRGTNANYGYPIHMLSNTQNIQIKNCVISTADANTTLGSTNQIPIVVSNSLSSYSTGVANVSNIEIDSNTISGGYFCIVFYGSNQNDNNNIKIRRNTIDKFYYYGLYVVTYGHFNVNYNRISQRVTTNLNGYAISFNSVVGNSASHEIIGNEIDFGSYGISLSSSGNNSGRGKMYNNSVYGNRASTNVYGIQLGSSNNWDIWHNSVNLNVPATDVNSWCLYISGSNATDVRNNTLVVSAFGSTARPFYSSTAAQLNALNYNNYFRAGMGDASALVNINNVDYSRASWNISGFNANSISKQPLFTSNTNLRLTGSALSPFGDPSLGVNTDIDLRTRCAAFPSIGASESPYVVVLDANVIADDTLFVDSPSDILNSSIEGEPKTHLWNVDGNIFTTVNVKYTFTNIGVYTIKLRTTGCSGIDSASKNVRVINPLVAPKSAFISDINEADQGYPVQLTDLSTGGASAWTWTITPSAGVSFSPSSNAQNPKVTFANVGAYNICLRASNSAGQGNLNCKTAYIKVIEANNLCGSKSKSKTATGKIFDDGGKNGAYGHSKNCSFLIDPCASEVTLSFINFSLEAGDVLRVYDGVDANGKPLHTSSGFSGSVIPADVTAATGKMFVQFITNATGNNAGFEAKWTAVAKSFNKPVAAFRAPDTLYTGTKFTFLSSSTGIDPDISWDFDNDGLSDANTAQAAYTFPQAGSYIVKLSVTDCGGTDNAVKVIKVIDPTGVPVPNFLSNYTIISPGQVVSFYDRSTQAPSSWEWSITPSTFTYQNGTDSSSQNPSIKFNAVGSYNITLKAKNAFGQGTATKTAYIRVVDYCFPGAGLNADIGISRVTFAGIDNVSLIGPATYTNYSQTVQSASVQKGAKYTITLARLTNAEDITRNVWIDYDGNGVFAANELVASHAPDKSLIWTDTITIPTTVNEGSTRMRIGTSYGLTKNGPCGINPFGEFEDYTVTIFNNLVRPVITIIGQNNISFELGGTYTDQGATATDDVEGNITSRMITTTDLDLTKPGSYTFRYNVSDLEGNSTEAIRYVTVTPDVTLPSVTLLGANPFIIPVGLAFNDPGATATDNVDGNITGKIVVTGGPVITAVPGQYLLTYTVEDSAGNIGSADRVVIVGDTTRPEIVLQDAHVMTIPLGATFVDPGAVVIDNVDFGLTYTVDLSVINNQKVGEYILTYKAQDNTGNQANPAYRTVIVADMTPPAITLIGDTMVIDVNTNFVDPGYILTDNYYPSDSIKVSVTGSVNKNFVGVYFLIYIAEDPSGNKSVLKTRVVKVVDNIRPVIVLNGDPFRTICRWDDYTDAGATVIDNYDSNLPVVTVGSVQPETEGIYALTYMAEDKSRNQAIQVTRVISVISCITSNKKVSDNASSFNVYPNPSQGRFTVSLDNGSVESFTVEVKDMMGRTVNAEVVVDAITGVATVQMQNASSGVYFVTVTSGNQVTTKKIEIIK